METGRPQRRTKAKAQNLHYIETRNNFYQQKRDPLQKLALSPLGSPIGKTIVQKEIFVI